MEQEEIMFTYIHTNDFLGPFAYKDEVFIIIIVIIIIYFFIFIFIIIISYIYK